MGKDIPKEILALAQSIKRKRPKIVVEHIINHGGITTEELNEIYGYDHPPRAARDVREAGIPLKTTYVISSKTGRKIAKYDFGDVSGIQYGRIDGRLAFPKRFKEELIEQNGQKDAFSGAFLDKKCLQIDHRIPYEVAGNEFDSNLEHRNYMLLDSSSQRAKSWACEHCSNWNSSKLIEICKQCYWAFPELYTHIAMEEIRRVEISFQGPDIKTYKRLEVKAQSMGLTVKELITIYIKEAASKDS